MAAVAIGGGCAVFFFIVHVYSLLKEDAKKLVQACESGNLAEIEEKHGLRIYVEGTTPLARCLEHGHLRCAAFLVDKGASISEAWAIMYENAKRAKENDPAKTTRELLNPLVNTSKTPRSRSISANLPPWACVFCVICFSLVVTFIMIGNRAIKSDADLYNSFIWTIIVPSLVCIPIYWARRHHLRADLLLQACEQGNLNEIHYQVSYGMSPDSTDSFGNTALMICCSFGHIECVRYLLHKGADISRVNKSGVTALEKANNGNNEELVNYLKKKA